MNKEWYMLEEELFPEGGFIKTPKKERNIPKDPWEDSKNKVAEYKSRARSKYKTKYDQHNI